MWSCEVVRCDHREHMRTTSVLPAKFKDDCPNGITCQAEKSSPARHVSLGTFTIHIHTYMQASLWPRGFRMWQMFVLRVRPEIEWISFSSACVHTDTHPHKQTRRPIFSLQSLSAPITEKLYSESRGDASWQDKTLMWWGHKPLWAHLANEDYNVCLPLCVAVCVFPSVILCQTTSASFRMLLCSLAFGHGALKFESHL